MTAEQNSLRTLLSKAETQEEVRRILIKAARKAKTPDQVNELESLAAEFLSDETAGNTTAGDGDDGQETEIEAGIAHGQDALARQNARTALTQEIGPLPKVKDPSRRARCKASLREFILTYFKAAAYLGLSPYQVEMVETFQRVILNGSKACRAVRRGGLKSTLARIAAIWAISNGHSQFVVIAGATDDKANECRDNLVKGIKAAAKEFLEDYPEVTPLVMKFRNPKKQLRLNGELITVSAKDERGCVLFPNTAGTECCEARIAPYSILATDVSGLAFVDDQGRSRRPDLLIFDDCQTPQSAKSFLMTNAREDAIDTTFMGLPGLAETPAAIMVCTRREEDDLTARYCDRDRHPDWDGKKYPVLISEPTNKELWSEYADLLRSGATPEDGLAAATAFYLKNHAAMIDGGKVAWEKDKEEAYADALQWVMTKKLIQPAFFRSELQQEGAAKQTGVIQLEARQIVTRLSHVPQRLVPTNASYLTAFVDSQNEILFWMVMAWTKEFSGWIVDRGTWPDQGRRQFYKSDIGRTISAELPDQSWEAAFTHAHNQVDKHLLRDWKTETGQTRAIDILLKDWSAGTHKPRIEAQVLASPNRSRIRPSKGFGPKPGKKPLHLYGDPKKDRHTSQHWTERRSETPVHIQFDANVWKSHAARRLQTIAAAPSSVLLFGSDEREHALLAEHFTAETAVEIVWDGAKGVAYEEIPGRDNDFWDCYVGNNVAASILGCVIPGEERKDATGRKRYSAAELRALHEKKGTA